MPDAPRIAVMQGRLLPNDLTESLIRSVVFTFYDFIRADPLLAPVFNQRISEAHWPEHLEKMCDFWSSALLRTKRYKGQPLPPHLNMPELNDSHFERWLSLFSRTLTQLCSEDIKQVFFELARRIANSFRMAVAFHRGENSLLLEPLKADNIHT